MNVSESTQAPTSARSCACSTLISKRLVAGIAASLAGGAVFGGMMHFMSMIPMIAGLVGRGRIGFRPRPLGSLPGNLHAGDVELAGPSLDRPKPDGTSDLRCRPRACLRGLDR